MESGPVVCVDAEGRSGGHIVVSVIEERHLNRWCTKMLERDRPDLVIRFGNPELRGGHYTVEDSAPARRAERLIEFMRGVRENRKGMTRNPAALQSRQRRRGRATPPESFDSD